MKHTLLSTAFVSLISITGLKAAESGAVGTHAGEVSLTYDEHRAPASVQSLAVEASLAGYESLKAAEAAANRVLAEKEAQSPCWAGFKKLMGCVFKAGRKHLVLLIQDLADGKVDGYGINSAGERVQIDHAGHAIETAVRGGIQLVRAKDLKKQPVNGIVLEQKKMSKKEMSALKVALEAQKSQPNLRPTPLPAIEEESKEN